MKENLIEQYNNALAGVKDAMLIVEINAYYLPLITKYDKTRSS